MKLFAVWIMMLIASSVVAHPANIPSARVHVNENQTVELHIRFDVLAFCLDATPLEVEDGPMLSLLRDPDLQGRLDDAKQRLIAAISVLSDLGPAKFKSIVFPTAAEVSARAKENGKNPLPLMMTVVVHESLPANATSISSIYPEALGTVIVTTELPFREPASEPVEPGSASARLELPTAAEISAARQALTPQPLATAPKVEQKKRQPEVSVNRRVQRRSRPASAVLPKEGPSSQTTIRPQSQSQVETTVEIANRANSNPSWLLVLERYIKMGFEHILPQGLDHILFVLGLFLLSRKTKSLVTQISAFTVAHSITLGLSLYGFVSLPSSVVEPLIAASIVFVAIENLFTTEMRAWRPFIVFAFGLVHGLGFAGALKGAGLAHGDLLTGLLGFNLGVELGQLAIVLLALAAIGWLRNKPCYRSAIVLPASCAIAAVALFWTIERIV